VAACLGLDEEQNRVDLHYLTSVEARAAVLCVLSSLQHRVAAGRPITSDVIFITGALSVPGTAFAILLCAGRFKEAYRV
jgi:hypothetical protein